MATVKKKITPPRIQPKRLPRAPAGAYRLRWPGVPSARTGLLVILLAGSLGLNLWNNDFPLGYHDDEPKKTWFILVRAQDFHHPLLMLQAARVVNAFLGLDAGQPVAVLGRSLSAVYATLSVLILYALLRDLLSWPYRFLATLAFATSPILVVHAHYLKEDALLTCLCLLSLLCLLRFLEEPDRRHVVLLGLSTGLALSSHYKALLLLLLYAVTIPVIGARPLGRLYTRLGRVGLLALGVFLVINYPLLFDPDRFVRGIQWDLARIETGHGIHFDPSYHFFSFHLVHSLVPGLTVTMALAALGGLVYVCVGRHRISPPDRIFLMYLALFHVPIELSASKPGPGFMRYVLPEVPILIYFAFKGLQALDASRPFRRAPSVAHALALIVLVLPLQSAVRLAYHLDRDTRAQASAYVNTRSQPAIFERFAAARGDILTASVLDLDRARKGGVRLIVTSSFDYDPYFAGASLPHQQRGVYAGAEAYKRLFKYPYVEIKPAYMSFAFSNPTIRIVDIRQPLRATD